jgi:hypothetical protein
MLTSIALSWSNGLLGDFQVRQAGRVDMRQLCANIGNDAIGRFRPYVRLDEQPARHESQFLAFVVSASPMAG